MGKEMGRSFGREGTCVILVDVGQKTSKFCKAIILQLKTKVQEKRHLAFGVSALVAGKGRHMTSENSSTGRIMVPSHWPLR